MAEYNHVLIVGADTAYALSDEIIDNAGNAGLALVLNNEGGLKALSKEFKTEDMERLKNVLPQNITPSKANLVLHKLKFRLGVNNLSRAVNSKDSARGY